MKIEAEVIEVKTTGDSLLVKLQGSPPSAAFWRRMEGQEIAVPLTKSSQRTFYIGRKFIITVKPR